MSQSVFYPGGSLLELPSRCKTAGGLEVSVGRAVPRGGSSVPGYDLNRSFCLKALMGCVLLVK